ncbi:hypothetical protein IB232_20030 [Pseudomonas sp. PDM15]|uniref:hypothetical protein n=1 Tax=Pseudomonas sp. PDM15 TaxID=2769303 RepID=UPI00177C813C|nr:hypothetical protein [Pseudomonas sp. PDM15]MBD9427632.1 hypothetical protein [Pseudomonas sp. PDM15]
MSQRFLLYIDILGFSEMTRKDPRKVARVYAILNTLNAHNSSRYKTIVFSDTILIYNVNPARNDEDRADLVWYLTEFAEDLHHRLTGQDIYFRAALVAGDFFHYELENIECFFGGALIDAYLAEKDIPSTGLFIDNECAKYNKFFRMARFNNRFSFVYLNRSLEALNQLSGGRYPLDLMNSPGEDFAPFVPWQVLFLKDVHLQMRTHPQPHVRTKFLTTWDFYLKRYPEMLRLLEQSQFDLATLAAPGSWARAERTMEKEIRYFKRIGSGTSLSKSISGWNAVAAPVLPVQQKNKKA